MLLTVFKLGKDVAHRELDGGESAAYRNLN